MNKLARLQVEMTQEQMDKLNRLQDVAGLRTKKDLIDNALTLFQWALREKVQGNSILSFNREEGTYKELEMPSLEHAATQQPWDTTSRKERQQKDREHALGRT